jgi:PAS domain S-box-containing protein
MNGITGDSLGEVKMDEITKSNKANEGLYQAIFETALDAIMIVDDEGRYVDVNPAMCRILKAPRSRLLGAHFSEFIPPDRLEDAVSAFSGLKTEGGLRMEFPLRAADGQIVELEWTSRAEFVPGLHFCAARDISDRKRVEQAHRASEERFTKAFNASPHPMTISTLDEGRYLDVNEATLRITGYTSAEMIGHTAGELDIWADDESRNRLVAMLKEQGEVRDLEVGLRSKNGEVRTVLMAAELTDFDGRSCILTASSDISERKRAEDDQRFLAEASSILATSLDYETTLASLARLTIPRLATYCAIDLVDEDKKLRQVAVAHKDLDKEGLVRELRRRNPYDDSLPHGVVKVLRTGKSEISPEITDSLITSYSTSDEYLEIIRELNPKSYMLVPLVARGRTLGVITFVADETGTRYDARSLELAEDLARRAALAIDNARLYGEVQRANRAKDEFLATVSHELRTPLNAILGWSHILRSNKLDEAATAKAYVIIERNARAQAQLIEDTLDISRIITGKLRLDMRPIDLDSVVGAAVEAMRPAADVKQISIETKIGPETCVVSGDANRLQQVVWNLLSNAIKFTPNNGRVEVRLDRFGANARLTVSDTGQGISQAFLPYVFDRFRQADSSTTRKHSGLGLGLAIVRHLVTLHGGGVRAESNGEGRGATFAITLPLVGLQHAEGKIEVEQDRKAGASVARSQEAETADPRAAMLEGLRVVIVDDQPDTLDMLRAALAAWGASVSCADTARQALQMIIESRPHVLVSDLGLPDEDGYELIRKVRELEPELGGLVPAIALTAYARAEDRRQSLEAGFQIHMTKPVEPVELAVVIAGLAGRTVKGLGA